jgi:hypothetical protein
MTQKNAAKSAAPKRAAAATAERATKRAAARPAAKKASAATSRKPDAASGAAVAEVKAKASAQPKEKTKKAKLVRDSFTMPEDEYRVLGEVKKACIKAGFEVKKSELLRVGVALIRQMDLPALKGMLAALPPLKAGRPKREK